MQGGDKDDQLQSLLFDQQNWYSEPVDLFECSCEQHKEDYMQERDYSTSSKTQVFEQQQEENQETSFQVDAKWDEKKDIQQDKRKQKNEKKYEMSHKLCKYPHQSKATLLQNKEMNAYIFRKRDFSMTNIPHLLQPFKKFYLFVDQLIDMDYLKSIASGDDEQYLKEDLDVSIFKGIKFVNEVKHRMDNKCIEVNSEYVDIFQNDIKPLVAYISSLGNKELYDLAQSLEVFWQQYVLQFQQQIKKQSEDPLFMAHQMKRQMEAEESFIEKTKDIDQSKYICYQYIKPNYKKYQFHSCRVGYTPCLYELLSGTSYKFIDNLQKKGYYDPFSKRYRLKQCLNNSKEYIKRKINLSKPNKENQFSPTEIVTMDNFILKAIFSSQRINLNSDYDAENNLQFKVNDLIVFNEFIFEEENIFEGLKEIRKINQNSKQSILSEPEINWSEYDSDKTEFYNKYYRDEEEDLQKKGNKWNKRCGFIDIDKKRKSK